MIIQNSNAVSGHRSHINSTRNDLHKYEGYINYLIDRVHQEANSKTCDIRGHKTKLKGCMSTHITSEHLK